jgi:hypothetical protein
MDMIRQNKQEDALIHKIRFVISRKGQVAIASVLNYFFNHLHMAFAIFIRADFLHLLLRQ